MQSIPAVRSTILKACAACLLVSWPDQGVTADYTPEQLAEMNLEQLLGATVTSVARREEQLAQSPAAVQVITQEEIRRSGATNLAEVLRIVPGLEVARVDAHSWAISSRGFNGVFANKLLVLIDGRSVYTPLFSGVHWNTTDTLLEDIERIEVIRGPGAALWGANAVNGVINVITKKAAATQGTLVSGGIGTEERGFGEIRYGGRIGETIHYRVFGKYFDRGSSLLWNGETADDDWQMGRLGFRVDWDAPQSNFLTLQGDLYSGHQDQVYRRIEEREPFLPYMDHHTDAVSGGNILGRWTHTFSEGGEFVLQTYYDQSERNTATLGENRDSFDVDFQHRFGWGERQTIVWGGGYRRDSDELRSTFDVAFDPAGRTTDLFSAFLQDEITLVKKRVTLTLGSKLEHNDYSGFEIQPNARLLWTPTARHSVWASVSRAVRTPSRSDVDITVHSEPIVPRGALFAGFPPRIPPSPTIVTAFRGDHDFESEELIAYEAGYRLKVNERLSFDLAVFFNDYDQLRSISATDPALNLNTAPAEMTFTAANQLKGQTYGGEISTNLRVTDWWRLRADYSLLQMQLHLAGSSPEPYTDRAIEHSSPQNQFALRSWMDLPHGFECDAALRYVDALPALKVPAYFAVDVRLGWRPSKNVEISVVGQGLLDRHHREFAPSFLSSQYTEVETSVYGKVTLRF